MAWEINRFGVKPSGIASWRYVRILIDENGSLSVADVPGEPSINLDCLSDYKRNDRGIWANQLITEFCNTVTHTNYRVYAQDCRPWAYVQTDLNAKKCGYQEPLPEPAVPPNPFGTAAYGEYRYFNFCDDKNVPVKIKIFKRGFNGNTRSLDHAGPSPVVLSYKNTDDDKFAPIRGMECRMTFVAAIDFSFQQFYTEDEREFRIEIYKNGLLKFKGFLVPSDAQEDFTAPPYDVILRATDGLGALKNISYPIPAGSSLDIKQNFVQILAYALAMTNLNLDIVTASNLYATEMKNGIDDDPMWQAEVNPLRMSENGVIFNCYKVIESVCRLFGAFIVQDNGKWNFTRQSELSNKVIRRRHYNYKGLYLRSEQFDNLRVATCNGSDITILNESPVLRIGNAYKRAEVKLDFGDIPATVYNGDFEMWDGHNFNYWTRYGGIDISRIEKTIQTVTGSFPTGDHAMQFNKQQDVNKYIQAAPIYVYKGDKLKLSFNVSRTVDTQSDIFPRPAYSFVFRISYKQYYLGNKTDGFEWVQQLTSATTFVQNHKGNIDTFMINLDLPEIPEEPGENDYLKIQLFGFQKIVQQSGRSTGSSGGRPGSGDTGSDVVYVPVQEYNPIYIDNFSIKRTKSVDKSEVNGMLFFSQQDGFYTKRPELTTIVYGDFSEQVTVNQAGVIFSNGRPSRAVNGVQTIESLSSVYAIRFNNQYTNGWYEYGLSASGTAIGMILAQNIMKAYQSPFRFLSGSFMGDDISYLDVFNVFLPNNESFSQRTFALLSGDLNLKTNELTNADYAEIFSKPAKTFDVTVPGYPDSIFPPLIQNPNPPAPLPEGIFGKAFSQEFR